MFNIKLPIAIARNSIVTPINQWLVKSFVVFTVLLTAPLDYKFWKYVFEDGLSFFTLFKLTNYVPEFIASNTYWNVFVLVILSLLTGLLWKGKNINYSNLYHWTRVVLRYRIGIVLVAYGFLKLFPLQMPFPSLSNLHTNYGDFYAWKIYYHTTGITPWYESFLGLIEIFAGALLFFRKTTTLGAGVIIGFSGNVFAANLAYQGGQEYLSLLILISSTFLFVYDFQRLFSLLYKFEQTEPNKIVPEYDVAWNRGRLIFKSAVGFYLLFIGLSFSFSWSRSPYKYPEGSGLEGTYGYYNVTTFKVNGLEIPYSRTDSIRWQNVVFESWPTISIASAKPIILDNSVPNDYRKYNYERNFESAGVGGRRYFHYEINDTQKILHLVNKNSNHKDEKFELHYEFIGDSVINLYGSDEQGRQIEAVLQRVNRKYMLLEGRRKPVKL